MDPLNQPPPPPPMGSPGDSNQARMWNMWCHLSALAGFVIPFGNVLGPLLVWQIKKNEFPSVVEHGKAALNFQLTVLIVLLVRIAPKVLLPVEGGQKGGKGYVAPKVTVTVDGWIRL